MIIIQRSVVEIATSPRLYMAERAARTCYRSVQGSTPGFCAGLLNAGHMTPFEFVSMAVTIVTSRAISHELVRHRHLSFCQESTRRVKCLGLLVPPDMPEEWGSATREAYEAYEQAWETGEQRDQARLLLPHNALTTLMVHGNVRAWVEFVQKRRAPQADAEIRYIAEVIQQEIDNCFAAG
jgi:thymidylate synthase (FAD)